MEEGSRAIRRQWELVMRCLTCGRGGVQAVAQLKHSYIRREKLQGRRVFPCDLRDNARGAGAGGFLTICESADEHDGHNVKASMR